MAYGDNPYSDWMDREAQLNLMGQPVEDPRRKQMQDLYTKHLGEGRVMDEAGYQAHLKNPGGMAGVEAAILGSQEYKDRQAAPKAAPAQDGSTAGWQRPSSYQAPGAEGSKTGWGFTEKTGGRGEFSYKPTDYGSDFRNLEGFRDQAALDADPNAQGSIKYIFRNATSGLDPSSESLDTVVKRLNEMGIPAQRVGPDSIDFGLGEGPMDVIRGGTPETGYLGWQWIPAGGGGAPAAGGQSSAGGGAMAGGNTAGQMAGDSDFMQMLMREANALANGQPSVLDREALIRMLTPQV